MNNFFFGFDGGGGCVTGIGILNCGALGGNGVGVWLELFLFWGGMAKMNECFFNVPWHGKVDFLLGVVPI